MRATEHRRDDSRAGGEVTDSVPVDTTTAQALAASGPGDTTGTETLGRYTYQVKVAVQRWLGTLASGGEVHIVCEFVDDITKVTDEAIVFAQVKTRDRGAWSVAKVLADGGGIDALVRSYHHARDAALVDRVRLELVLEGMESDRADTRAFFESPATANAEQRQAIVGLGLDPANVDDFLARLTITPQYHARQSIDAVTLSMLMGIAPVLPDALMTIYKTLLDRALAAHLGLNGASQEGSLVVLQAVAAEDGEDVYSGHALTRSELLTLLPPVPQLADEQRAVLEAANGGALAMTDLEFKLLVAGANAATVDRAKAVRADAAATLAARAGIEEGTDEPLIRLRDRVLEYAEAVTADVAASALSDVGGHRMANAIYGRLVQQFQQLGALDVDGIFSGEGRAVLGYLCETSDQCMYGWRPA